jgi:uncharacterized protein (TIGR02147 family)
MQSIFSFVTLHSALKELVDRFSQTQKPKLSQKLIAKEVGVSPALLTYILSGQRRVSFKIFQKFLALTEVTAEEEKFLSLLHKLSFASDPHDRNRLFQSLIAIAQRKGELIQEELVSHYLSTPLHSMIRELSTCQGFSLNEAELSQRLMGRYTKKEIKMAVDFLLRKKLIVQDSWGRWYYPTDQPMTCTAEVFGPAMLVSHLEFAKLGLEQVQAVDRSDRLLNALVIGLDEKSVAEARKILSSAIGQIQSLSSRSKPNRVHYFCVLQVPLTL